MRLTAFIFAVAVGTAFAVDPGEAWITEAGAGTPPVGIWWLPAATLCPVLKDRLPGAMKALESKSFEPLTAGSLVSYAGASCKGKYGELPYLVRAVSTTGDGHLDAGVSHGEIWMRFAGMGGKHPFVKTPVVLWLISPPAKVHVSASLVL